MSFHKRRLPDLQELKKIHEECDSDEDFIQRVVGKSEALSGSKESLDYLDLIYQKIISKNGEHKN